jgi:hypothetical protein
MLDADQLSKTGCLGPGRSSTCQWIDGNEVASINLRAESNRLIPCGSGIGNGET